MPEPPGTPLNDDGLMMVARPPTRSPSSGGRANDVDAHVGTRIRLRRAALGLSQEKLAQALGLTFQQVQKYEKGVNRVGASRLYDLARVLDVPIGYFFDQLLPAAPPVEHTDVPTMPVADAGLKRETLELMRAYNGINDPIVRRRVYDLARALGDAADPPTRKA